MLARPGLPDFEYLKAESPQEVFALLKERSPDIKLLMGGTDLFIQMRDQDSGPSTLMDIKGIPGMREIEFDKKKGLTLGAAITLNQLSDLLVYRDYVFVLVQQRKIHEAKFPDLENYPAIHPLAQDRYSLTRREESSKVSG